MYSSTAVRTALAAEYTQQFVAAPYRDFYVLRSTAIPQIKLLVARDGTFRRSPLAELGGDTSSFVGNTDGCRVGEAWLGRAAARGWAALESRCFTGHPKTENSIPYPKRRHHDYVSVLNNVLRSIELSFGFAP